MKKLFLKLLQCGFAVVALTLLLQQAPVVSARDHDVTILPPSSHPYGRSYAEWSNAWWQWAYSIPESINPVKDQKGKYCQVGQKGPVWFLGGAFTNDSVTRHCTVPRGKALFIPMANTEDDNIGYDTDPRTVDQLRAEVEPYLDHPTFLYARIDGEDIPHLGRYFTGFNGPVYRFHLPQDNVIDLSDGSKPHAGYYYPAISGGYYLMIAPLSPGRHTIRVESARHVGKVTLNQDVTYHLYVSNEEKE